MKVLLSCMNTKHIQNADVKELAYRYGQTSIFAACFFLDWPHLYKSSIFQSNLKSRTHRGQWLWNGSQCQFPTLPDARSSRINLGKDVISVNDKTKIKLKNIYLTTSAGVGMLLSFPPSSSFCLECLMIFFASSIS